MGAVGGVATVGGAGGVATVGGVGSATEAAIKQQPSPTAPRLSPQVKYLVVYFIFIFTIQLTIGCSQKRNFSHLKWFLSRNKCNSLR